MYLSEMCASMPSTIGQKQWLISYFKRTWNLKASEKKYLFSQHSVLTGNLVFFVSKEVWLFQKHKPMSNKARNSVKIKHNMDLIIWKSLATFEPSKVLPLSSTEIITISRECFELYFWIRLFVRELNIKFPRFYQSALPVPNLNGERTNKNAVLMTIPFPMA